LLDETSNKFKPLLAMTELHQSCPALTFDVEDSEEFDGLLDKKSHFGIKKNGPIYDLEKISGAMTPIPDTINKQMPSHLNDGLKKLLRPSSNLDSDTEPSSQRSEDDYLPSTLRVAISITNETNNDNPAAAPTAASSRKTSNSQKKKPRSIRRTKSDKSKNRRASTVEDEKTTKSLHARIPDTSSHQEKLVPDSSSDRMFQSEELRKPENRDSEKNRRRSENLHERPSNNRREKGRQRKGNSSRDLAPSKPSSYRKPKSTRSSITKASSVSSKNLGIAQEPSSSEIQKEKSQQKLKKSSSEGKNVKKTKRSSKSKKSLLQGPVVPEGDNGSFDWKRRSPPQESRKKPSKQKQDSKQSDPQKSAESDPTKPKKPKSRRAMMMSSMATTDSCRDLLRKIHAINKDRLSGGNLTPLTINEESQTTSADKLSSSTRSLKQNKARKETRRSGSNTKKPKEDSLTVSNRSLNSGKSQRKLQEEEQPRKPPRTKSAPLMVKGKTFNGKMPSSANSNILRTTDAGDEQPKQKKKSLSSRLLGMLPDGKGTGESKNTEDVTICTGNRSKDKKERKRFLRRSKSDSSLRESSHKKEQSGYDLMISMHSISERLGKNETRKDIQDDIESDEEDSFTECKSKIEAPKPVKRRSCLQIDFSQLSAHGTTGNIIVRNKKLEKRVGTKIGKPKSNRNIQT